MTEKKEGGYTAPKCKSCDAELKFVRAKNKDGIIKAHPVNPIAILLLVSTGEQDEEGKYIYAYRKGYQSHFATCPAADQHRKGSGEKAADADGEEQPPF